jgi:hypothetical protein
MKTLVQYLVSLSFVVLLQTTVYSQDVMQKFATQLKSGNTEALSQSFSETIELNIEGSRSEVSKNESTSILKNFFSQHPANDFKLVHQGASGSSSFAIGEFTHNGVSYRLMIKIKDNIIEKLEITQK